MQVEVRSHFNFKLYCRLRVSHVITTHFVYMNTNDWFEKKATVFPSEIVEMISTFQWNRHFRKLSVNKTFSHVEEQKKSDVTATFRLHSV